MVKAIRIYYTCFDDEKNLSLARKLKEIVESEIVEHRSSIPGFRYLEFKGVDLSDERRERIGEALREFLGENAYFRIDYINL